MTKGKKCHRCKQEGHFQICCKTKLKKDKTKQRKSKVHWVESASGDESDDEQIFIIEINLLLSMYKLQESR